MLCTVWLSVWVHAADDYSEVHSTRGTPAVVHGQGQLVLRDGSPPLVVSWRMCRELEARLHTGPATLRCYRRFGTDAAGIPG